VSVITVNKLSLQEINQLIGIELLTSGFIENFDPWSQFPGGEMPVSPLADVHVFDLPRVQNCLLEFNVKAHYDSHSLRIYMFSNNIDLKNYNRNYRRPS